MKFAASFNCATVKKVWYSLHFRVFTRIHPSPLTHTHTHAHSPLTVLLLTVLNQHFCYNSSSFVRSVFVEVQFFFFFFFFFFFLVCHFMSCSLYSVTCERCVRDCDRSSIFLYFCTFRIGSAAIAVHFHRVLFICYRGCVVLSFQFILPSSRALWGLCS